MLAHAISKELAEAKESYKTKVKGLAGLVTKELDRIEASSRKAGSFELLEKIKNERIDFERDGTIPTVIPAKEYRRRLERPRDVLRKAFLKARSDYTRARLDVEAERVMKELANLQAVWNTVSFLGRPHYWGPPDIWAHDGDELVMTRPPDEGAGVAFGTAELRDFDMHFQAKAVGGPGWFCMMFHEDDGNFCVRHWDDRPQECDAKRPA